MEKSTAFLLQELQGCSDFRSFYRENAEYLPKRDLAELLDELLQKHQIKKAEAIRRAELSEVYGYQIFWDFACRSGRSCWRWLSGCG